MVLSIWVETKILPSDWNRTSNLGMSQVFRYSPMLFQLSYRRLSASTVACLVARWIMFTSRAATGVKKHLTNGSLHLGREKKNSFGLDLNQQPWDITGVLL
jgi:hypothetical protein